MPAWLVTMREDTCWAYIEVKSMFGMDVLSVCCRRQQCWLMQMAKLSLSCPVPYYLVLMSALLVWSGLVGLVCSGLLCSALALPCTIGLVGLVFAWLGLAWICWIVLG